MICSRHFKSVLSNLMNYGWRVRGVDVVGRTLVLVVAFLCRSVDGEAAPHQFASDKHLSYAIY